MKKISMAIAIALMALSADTALASLANEGPQDTMNPEYFSVRYHSFGNPSGQKEIWLGYGDLLRGRDRSAGHVKQWSYGESANTFFFTYLPGEDRLTTTVVSPVSGSRTVTFDGVSSRFANPDLLNNLNTIKIMIETQAAGISVALEDVVLNGESLGSFRSLPASSGTLTWYLGGYDLSGGFEMSGKIVLNEAGGRFRPEDRSKVQISAGVVPIPIPGAAWLFGSGLAASIALRYRRRQSGRAPRG